MKIILDITYQEYGMILNTIGEKLDYYKDKRSKTKESMAKAKELFPEDIDNINSFKALYRIEDRNVERYAKLYNYLAK